MGVRRQGRELALMLLYREEVTGLTDHVIPGLADVPGASLEFAEELVAGVRRHLARIDEAISSASEHWDIGRMGAVDRTIIRIGAYELMCEQGTPIGAIINEAVDAARKYSTSECGRFVNGVLDKIAREVRDDAGSVNGQMEDGAARDRE
jgi:N utilization substance protein B